LLCLCVVYFSCVFLLCLLLYLFLFPFVNVIRKFMCVTGT
jgi:hypothetical protein